MEDSLFYFLGGVIGVLMKWIIPLVFAVVIGNKCGDLL